MWGPARRMVDAIFVKSFFLSSHLRTVDIEPPVTDEVLLIEQSSVRTEEAVLDQGTAAVRSANMK